jgi:hypothetical protein
MKEPESLFKLVPPMFQGHTLFEINHHTKEIVVANTFVDEQGKRRCMPQEGCEYVAALNMKNAIKKYNRGK